MTAILAAWAKARPLRHRPGALIVLGVHPGLQNGFAVVDQAGGFLIDKFKIKPIAARAPRSACRSPALAILSAPSASRRCPSRAFLVGLPLRPRYRVD